MFPCCTCNTSVKYYFLLQLNQEDGQGEEVLSGSGRGSWKKLSRRKSSPSEQKTKSSSSSSDEGNFGLQIYDLDFAWKYVSHFFKTIDIFYLMHIRPKKKTATTRRILKMGVTKMSLKAKTATARILKQKTIKKLWMGTNHRVVLHDHTVMKVFINYEVSY